MVVPFGQEPLKNWLTLGGYLFRNSLSKQVSIIEFLAGFGVIGSSPMLRKNFFAGSGENWALQIPSDPTTHQKTASNKLLCFAYATIRLCPLLTLDEAFRGLYARNSHYCG